LIFQKAWVAALDGIAAGAIIGVGVVAMEGLKAVVYDKHSWPRYAINNGYSVVGIVAAGAIYGAFA